MLTSVGQAAARRMLPSKAAPSFRFAHRAFILRQAMPSVRMISISASMRTPAAAAAAATAAKSTAKTASASKKPAVKKSATKKTTTSTTTKTTAKPKPKPKPKAKAKVKAKKPKAKAPAKKKAVKKPKKELTPQEKARAELRELKKMALLQGPTHLTSSAWSVYVGNNMPKGDSTLGDKIRAVAADFKNLPESEIQRLQAIADTNQVANTDARKAWIQSYPPEAIYMANLARRRLARKLQKSRLYLLHDDRQPRRALTPYTHFIKDRFSQSSEGSVQDAFRAFGQQWKTLSEAEKAPYTQQATADVKRSTEELKVMRQKGKVYWKAQLAKPQPKSTASQTSS